MDSLGHRYDPDPAAGQVPFDTLPHPGQSIVALRTFKVPVTACSPGVVVAREGGFDFPRCCILGEGPFRTPPITYLVSP
jgi:hypothetical protein